MKRGITDVNDICEIVSLNSDVEPLVIQASATRTRFFREIAEDRFRPLRLVHFSDIHAVPELWDRIVRRSMLISTGPESPARGVYTTASEITIPSRLPTG